MKLQKFQPGGGRKETAPLARGGRESQGSDQSRVYIPTDAEYTYYNELLQGYFEKLIRWKEILYTQGMVDSSSSYGLRGVYVVRSENSLSIEPGVTPAKMHVIADEPPPGTILEVRCGELRSSTPTEFGYSTPNLDEMFSIKPTPAGRQFLVDTKGVSLNHVTVEAITASNADGTPTNYLDIEAYLPSDIPRRLTTRKDVRYIIRENELEIRRGQFAEEPMSDDYATHLFDTIDALIPGSTSPTSQPEGRTRQEVQTPKALPPARRTPGS